MTDRRILDTNLIVRHLVQDYEAHAKVATKLFVACDRGELELVILPAVLAECVFVLESFYKHSRQAIADALQQLIGSPGIEIEDSDVHADALARFRDTKLHFVDCLIAASAAAGGIAVATFDRGFKKFPDVKVNVKP